MDKKAKMSRLAGIPAWALSSLTLLPLFILLFILEDPKSSSYSTNQIIGYSFGIIFLAVACFLICRTHPKSVWYTPVICNAVGIVAIIVYIFTDLSTSSELMLWLVSLVLSIIGAMAGARVGRHRINQAK
jgi:hypothetical protein